MDKEKVLKLAKLARIEISPDEAEGLSHDLGSILSYVKEIKDAGPASHGATQNRSAYALRNVMRRDESAHESGIYTEEILSQAPDRAGGYIRVKKIL